MNMIGVVIIALIGYVVCLTIISEVFWFYHDNVRNGQIVIRVFDTESLKMTKTGFSSWDSEYTDNPVVIGKILEHLRSASAIRLYIDNTYIQYTAETKKRGQVCGSCKRAGYDFFTFGIRKSGHRFDIYGEDRDNPTVKAFYDWWGKIVKPYEKEFDKDFNL